MAAERMMKVSLPQQLYDAIKIHALHTSPRECCGMVAAQDGEPVAVYLANNMAEDPYNNFLVDPTQQQSFMETLEQAEMRLWGIYHSHPRSDAHPGRRDIQAARNWPEQVHLIVGMDGSLVMRAWRVDPYVRALELTIQ